MLPALFMWVSIGLRLLSGASYARATWQKSAQPHLVSWFFWSLTALVAFVASVSDGLGRDALVTLAIGLGPLLVCGIVLYRGVGVYELNKLELFCIAMTALGIVLWLITANPLHAVLCGIAADIFSSVPTVRKCYLKPHSEYASSYMLSIASMLVGLLTFTNWQPVNWLFPAYILLINVTFVTAKMTGLLRLSGHRVAEQAR